MTFSQKLKFLRTKKNINMSQLSREIGVSRSIISKYEKGERFPSIEIVKLLANYFDVSIDYLLSNENFKEKSPPFLGELFNHDMQTIYKLYSALDTESQKKAYEYLDMLLLKQRQIQKGNKDSE